MTNQSAEVFGPGFLGLKLVFARRSEVSHLPVVARYLLLTSCHLSFLVLATLRAIKQARSRLTLDGTAVGLGAGSLWAICCNSGSLPSLILSAIILSFRCAEDAPSTKMSGVAAFLGTVGSVQVLHWGLFDVRCSLPPLRL